MKGLLVKDLLTMAKQMRLFLLMIVVFSFLPGFSTNSFAVIYAAMMPVAALAYDERSKWNKLAAMMPYSDAQLVFSKYLLCYILVLASALLCAGAELLTGNVRGETAVELLLVVCLAFFIQSVHLPLMLRIGVEKARLVFIALTAFIVAAGMAAGRRLMDWVLGLDVAPAVLAGAAVLAVALLNVVSVFISIRLYAKKET